MTLAQITPTEILVAAKRDRLSKFVLLKDEISSITVKFSDVKGFEQFMPCAIKIPKSDFRNRWIFDELKVSMSMTRNKFQDKVTTKNSRPLK